MFHKVHIHVSYDDKIICVPVITGELSCFLNILEDSHKVKQFKVDEGATEKMFGWGTFNKWVTKFTYE